MTSSSVHLYELAELIERVGSGELEPEDALARCGDLDQYREPLAARAWHALSHFANDSDIRGSDLRYVESQRATLRKCAAALRQFLYSEKGDGA